MSPKRGSFRWGKPLANAFQNMRPSCPEKPWPSLGTLRKSVRCSDSACDLGARAALLLLCFLSASLASAQDLSLDDLVPASAPPAFPILASETRASIRPPLPEGTLELIVETVRERTPNRISMMAVRVEVWRGDHPLAVLAKGDEGVDEEFRRRRFRFPAIPLPKGYHFITIRAFAEGPISREQKWKGDTFQIGVDPGKTVKVTRNVSFFVW